MIQTKQGQYLWIKQRLDRYNISTTFPLQMMPLLQSLLNRLDLEVGKSNSLSYEKLKGSVESVNQIQLTNKLIPDALKLQISRVTQQSSQLHMEVITLTQELRSLRHCLDKLAIQKSDNKTQIERIIAFKNDKEEEIRQQLKLVKFKYNELMDFIHSNDNLQKMYLKRLLTHRKFEIKDQDHSINYLQDTNIKSSQRKSNTRQDLNSRITFNAKNSSSRQKQTRSRINLTLQQNTIQKPVEHPSNQQFKNLKEKFINRERQIQRLQSLLTFNGPDINKILTQYNQSMQSKRNHETNQKIQHLETQNQKLIKDLKNAKNNAGRYQALRDQVDKCHEIIKGLKQQNRSIKRSLKENNYNHEKKDKQNQRSMGVFNAKNSQLKLTKFNDDLKIEDLKAKILFYQKQFGIIKNKDQGRKQVSKKSTQKKTQKKKIQINQNEDNQKEVTRKTYQSHIKLSNQKNGSKIKTDKKNNKSELIKENKKKHEIIPKIPKIISEQSEEQSIEQKQLQNGGNAQSQPHVPYQIKHSVQKQGKQNKPLSQSESEESSQEEDQNNKKSKDQTLAEQYLETINELTTKCLVLKEQLQSKNNAIRGLEEILNRLMAQKQNDLQLLKESQILNSKNLISSQNSIEVSKLRKQVQTLSSLLNQSEFQKQELRRQFIEMQKLYKQLPLQSEQKSLQKTVSCLKSKIGELEQIIIQKDEKIENMREDNSQIQDKLLKSLDRIKRLNDQIQVLTKQKQGLMRDFQLSSLKLNETSSLLRKEQQKNSTTMQLSEIQKDEIILLRKNLLQAKGRIDQLQNYIFQMQKENPRVLPDESDEEFK